MTMTPIIMDSSFNWIAQADDFISFIWTTRYYSAGDFELCVNSDYYDIITTNNYITRGEDYSHVGIIEDIQYKYDEDHQEMIIAKGRLLTGILGRRVIASQTILQGSVTDCIQSLIEENAINPASNARKFTGLSFLNTSSVSEVIDVQYTGENLLETIESICETNGIGLDLVLNNDGTMTVKLYDGTNRSYSQNVNPYVIFSDTFDNLLSAEYEKDMTEYATDVLVGGEGEGTGRTMVWASEGSNSGFSRYEKFLDASTAVSNDEIITQATYESQLNGLGLNEITKYTTAFMGEVDFSGVKLGTDINVGDICVIEYSKWGMSINSRLVEVIESISEDGTYSAVPTFGT